MPRVESGINPSAQTGLSGVGGKVNCLFASLLAKGLVHKGIFQRGAATGAQMKHLKATGVKFFVGLGVNKDNASPWWLMIFNLLAGGAGAQTPDPGFTDTDRQISENMMALWSRFARAGNPNIEGPAEWPEYDSATDRYLYINESLQVKYGFSKVGQEQ